MFPKISLALFAVCVVVPLGLAHLSESRATGPAATGCDANQATLNACAERKLRDAEALMNKALSALMDVVRGTDSEAMLKESQGSWLKFREADCRYVVSGLTPDGSMREQWQNDCRARRTDERTKELKEMGQCVSAGCPGQ